MKASSSSSRRSFLRSAGMLAGGAWLARYATSDLFAREAHAAARQAVTVPADPVAAFRAQAGASPIESTPLGDRLVLLSGPGGNVVVLHGPDGKIVVDSFLQPAWPRLKGALDALDDGPVKTLIDTHWHFDHTDNNANFRAAGATVLAHANTKTRMTQPHELLGMHFDPSPAEALPSRTFTSRQEIRANGEQIDLRHVPPGHTDTDIFVHYRKADVLHMGDLFFNGFYPVIDAGTGGTINGMIAGAGRALGLITPRTRIVPGHGPLADRAALDSYRRMLTAVRDTVRGLKKAGRTLAQVQAEKPSAGFDAAWGKKLIPPDAFVAQVYNTL